MPINSFSPPRIVIDTNSPAHAESSPHVRRTLDINRESDIHAVAGTLQTPISIHALRKESDPGTLRLTKRSKNFNPHSPCGERRHQHLQRARTQDFNPHSPCGERRGLQDAFGFVHGISIHTPLAGSDLAWRAENHRRNISIHTPLAGSDQLRLALHSLWGRISIHTPLAGSDVMLENAFQTPSDFNPHSPCGERRARNRRWTVHRQISIHTPLAGSDRRNETFLTK